MRPIAVEALADFFSMFPSVKCVVLNACYTEPQAQAISKHIDYVLGMPHTINDKLAIIFAVAFYDAIAAAKSIEFAFKLSSNALHLEGVSSDSLPVIKVKQKLINSGVEANSQHLPTPPLLPNIQSYGNEPLYRRGIMRATQGNYAGAEADFAVVLEKYPAAELHFLRGVSRSLQLNYAAAESDFTIAIELGIRNADIYHRRGVMRGAQDKFAEAEEDFTAAIAYGHKDGEVYFLRSETRRQQGDYPGAEADLTAAIERGYMPQRHD